MPERVAAPRYATIDLMRGLVILFIVLFHVALRFEQNGYEVSEGLPRWLGSALFGNGQNTRAVLFAMSGFIITETSIRRFGSLAKMSPGRFYRLRFARIGPPLLLLLGLLSVLAVMGVPGFAIKAEGGKTLAGALFAALTFHLNWYEAVHGYLPIFWDILWTLSVEEMFYFFFPLVCAGVLRLRHGMTLLIAGLVGLVCLGPPARTVWAFNEIWEKKSYFGAMDGIALGVLTAMLTVRVRAGGGWSPRVLRGLEAVGVALVMTVAVGIRTEWLRVGRRWLIVHGLDGTVMAVGVCLVMFATVVLDRPGWRWTAPMRWYGRHSYEVYLTHEFAVVAVGLVYMHFERGWLGLWVGVILLLTAPVGWAFSKGWSEPMNRVLRG